MYPPIRSATLAPEGCDTARLLFKEVVASAYRERRLTVEQVRQLLRYGTRIQVDPFLLKHEIYDYTVKDLDADMATMERLFPSKPNPSRT